MISATPLNSLTSSPVNLYNSDLDFLLNKKSLKLEPLTIHKPRFTSPPLISPNFAKNITVRKKNNGGSRHYRGRTKDADSGIRNLSLVDVPILDIFDKQPLRASVVGNPPP